MPNKFLLIFLFWGIIIGHVLAQGTIQLDRPDQTECPFIVPQNYIQFESGFSVENTNSSTKSYNYPSILWKYGLNERFELRLITEQVAEKIENKTISGLMPITIGFKTNICQEKGIIPITSFIGHLTMAKTGTKAFQSSFIAPSFRFVMQHTLSDRISLAYNLGAEWDGEVAEQTGIYTLTTGISLSQKMGVYVELYGFVPKKSLADHRFDGGLTYLINKDFMIDLSAGLSITKNTPKNYVAFGVSYRLNTSLKKNN